LSKDFFNKVELGLGEVADIDMVIPPLADQVAIVAHLDTELAKFDTLTAEAQRAIDLLQERRTALISAAVTGQIDVRGVSLRKLD
jgi:type I restriction enzyme S subunit